MLDHRQRQGVLAPLAFVAVSGEAHGVTLLGRWSMANPLTSARSSSAATPGDGLAVHSSLETIRDASSDGSCIGVCGLDGQHPASTGSHPSGVLDLESCHARLAESRVSPADCSVERRSAVITALECQANGADATAGGAS